MRARLPTIGPAFASVGSAYSNILFSSCAWLGWVLLGVTFLRPVSGLAGLLSVVTANLVARTLGYRSDAIQAGHYGFNALLLGLALSVGHGLDPTTVLLCLLGGAGAALLTAFFNDLLHRGLGLPALVLPFVVLGAMAFAAGHEGGQRFMLEDTPIIPLDLPKDGLLALTMRSFGSFFFQPSLVAGALVLVACLVVSRIATLMAFAGIVVALGTSHLLRPGADPSLSLIASYNGALTAIAVGTFFFVPGRASFVAGLTSSALAAWLSLAFLSTARLPVLAWPFVLVTVVAVRALRLRAPDRAPYAPPLPGQSPEANLEHVATFERRFGIPGPPQLYLPVSGTWFISQGTEGEHTHKGAWAGALDFEIADADGFPFKDQGTETEDYYCFGAPVYAPGNGTVAAVHEGVPDGKPGDINVEQSWGNAVVIQHGPELFSVLAHLKCGSVAVKPGQYVTSGQVVAACGSSGRAPRPHLHLQAQRTAELGAEAIPFRLTHYTAGESKERQQYVFLGIPQEGDRVSSVALHPIVNAFAALPPGYEINLLTEADGRTLRFRSEISLLGERSLVDVDRGDRLFFHAVYGSLSFTTYVGRPDGPLRALFLALPRLPSAVGESVRFVDEPPPALLLSRPARWIHELFRPLLDPVRTQANVQLTTTGESLSIETEMGLGVTRSVPPRYRSRTELDSLGLVRIEVTDLRHPEKPLLAARRAA